MPTTFTPTSLILVAVIPAPRDLEIARLLGWYRIPLRTAPKVIAVDYLAFYQTGAFDQGRWRIEYVAPVQGHELTTRVGLLREDANHPRAKEEYYKIQIGPLEALPQPILADKWRRITFFYTTGEYLSRARTIRDLIVQTDERKVLWNALRERMSQEQTYQTGEPPALDLDSETLAALLGLTALEHSRRQSQ